MKFLIENGAEVSSKDEYHFTPLIHAAENGNEVIHFCDGMKMILFLLCVGHLDVVKILVENGADVNANSGSNYTPLIWAAKNDNELIFSEIAHIHVLI